MEKLKTAPFKKGEWVRHIEANHVFQVEEIELLEDKWVLTQKPYILYSADKCEKFIPKWGEFWTISTPEGTWIEDMHYYSYCIVTSKPSFSIGFEGYNDIVELRPSTEVEIKFLIQEVEKTFKKTYKEEYKEWVDMPDIIVKGVSITTLGEADLYPSKEEEIDIASFLIDNIKLDDNEKDAKIAKIAVANSETIELLVKAGALKDPDNPDDTRSYNIGKSDYAGKSIIEPWTLWYLWDFLTSWDHDIIKRLYRTKEGTSRIEDYEKIIHDCKERIRQLK